MALRIPDKYRRKSLHIYCTKCKKVKSSSTARCDAKNVLARNCPYKASHRFQSRIWNPITKRVDCIKTHQTRDFPEAYRYHLHYRDELIKNNYYVISKTEKQKVTMLKDAIIAYLNYLEDVDVPEHQKKRRSKQYIGDNERYLHNFAEVLKSKGISLSLMKIDAVNDDHVGMFHRWLESNPKLGDRSYNAHMVALRYFYNYCNNQLGLKIENPFANVTLKLLNYDPQIISEEEFNLFLKTITPENQWGYKGQKRRERVNYYRDWLKDYFTASLMIGDRREGIAEMKCSDVFENYIGIPNLKINNLRKTHVYWSYTPITRDLADLLLRIGCEPGADRYLLVPEWQNRKTLCQFVTKAFTHFWKLSGIQKKATYHNLRITYVTRMLELLGEPGSTLKHTRPDVALKNYLDQREIVNKVSDRVLFNL